MGYKSKIKKVKRCLDGLLHDTSERLLVMFKMDITLPFISLGLKKIYIYVQGCMYLIKKTVKQ